MREKHAPQSAGRQYNNMMVCPACSALWDRVLNEHFLRGTEYYYVKEAKE